MAEFEFLRAGNSEATEKKALSALFAATSGVLSGLVVTQTTTASGSVLIASGSALVHPSAVSASLLGNDTSKTLDVFTANPMGGLPRNDIVEFDQITASIIVNVGVPNATPSDPTVPATSLALALLRHAASATTIPTAKIDDLRVDTTLRGTPVPVVSGALVTGSYDATEPIKTLYRRQNATADSNGLVVITLANTAVLSASMTVETTTGGVAFTILRGDLTSSAQVVFQLRNAASAGAALPSVAYTVQARIEYQD